MNGKKFSGWIATVVGAWFLFSGVLTNDMGGLIALGHNPDLPLTFNREPGRFLLGVVLYGAMIVAGVVTLLKARDEELDRGRHDEMPPRERW